MKLKDILHESKLTKSSLNGIDKDVINDVRDGYYKMGDAIQNLKYSYMKASQDNPDWETEYKIFKQIYSLFNKLETGRIL